MSDNSTYKEIDNLKEELAKKEHMTFLYSEMVKTLEEKIKILEEHIEKIYKI